jgi:hypothetical protein
MICCKTETQDFTLQTEGSAMSVSTFLELFAMNMPKINVRKVKMLKII